MDTPVDTTGAASSEESFVTVQNVSEDDDVPEPAQFKHWVGVTLEVLKRPMQEVAVRLVDDQEMRELNQRYRGQDKTTNVLSFQFDTPPGLNMQDHRELDILGDIVISPVQTRREALDQSKLPVAHFAHLCVHAVLHLCGYDHVTERDAAKMQYIESKIIQGLGYSDPWPEPPAADVQRARTSQSASREAGTLS